ncbi:MAG: hemolysin family protein, partial [Gemmatimonadaceae bacterium]
TVVAFAFALGAVTYVSVVLGELVPKALTLDRSESVAVLVSRPVELIARVLRPAVAVLQRSAALVLRPFGVTDVVAGDAVTTPEELRAIVDEAEKGGVIPQAQEELLHNVFDFATREARDVMIPAPDVEWLDADLQVRTALDRVLEGTHTRFPVGRGGLDRVAGLVHLRDLAATSDAATVGDAARDVLIVPPTKDLGALLREMREQHQQLVVVADEYGGTDGIVTIEDILEEIVGDIHDEHDVEEPELEREGDRCFWVAGRVSLDALSDAVGHRFEADEVATVGGLVYTQLGRVPRPGEQFVLDGFRVVVERVKRRRIERVYFERVAPETDTEAEE